MDSPHKKFVREVDGHRRLKIVRRQYHDVWTTRGKAFIGIDLGRIIIKLAAYTVCLWSSSVILHNGLLLFDMRPADAYSGWATDVSERRLELAVAFFCLSLSSSYVAARFHILQRGGLSFLAAIKGLAETGIAVCMIWFVTLQKSENVSIMTVSGKVLNFKISGVDPETGGTLLSLGIGQGEEHNLIKLKLFILFNVVYFAYFLFLQIYYLTFSGLYAPLIPFTLKTPTIIPIYALDSIAAMLLAVSAIFSYSTASFQISLQNSSDDLQSMKASLGLGANGLAANGLAANGLAANGLAANGLAAKGFTANGLKPDGLIANGIAPDGLAANEPTGLSALPRAVNDLGFNAFAWNSLFATSEDPGIKLPLSDLSNATNAQAEKFGPPGSPGLKFRVQDKIDQGPLSLTPTPFLHIRIDRNDVLTILQHSPRGFRVRNKHIENSDHLGIEMPHLPRSRSKGKHARRSEAYPAVAHSGRNLNGEAMDEPRNLEAFEDLPAFKPNQMFLRIQNITRLLAFLLFALSAWGELGIVYATRTLATRQRKPSSNSA